MDHPPHGLASQSADGRTTFLPLTAVDVQATIVDTSAHVVVTQQFRRAGGSAEARYIFPTPASAAVCAFRMETSTGRVVRARVKEISRAREEYEQAVAGDKWAGLLQEVEPDAFVMSVGAIPPEEDVTISITYVQDLPQDDLASEIRFSFPTHIAERYGSVPAPLQGSSSSSCSARFRITVNVEMTSSIDSIWSPTHSITVCAGPVSQKTFTSIIELDTASPVSLDKDFVVSIRCADVAKPRCVAEVDERRQSVALSLTLVPRLGMDTIPEQEYIFVLDRSGSMQEDNRIAFAKSALQIFLRSLPAEGTLFNIVSFGSHCLPMWASSRNYFPQMLDYATVQVDAMQADMGGTEIYTALLHAIQSRNTRIPTSIFVLTDGKIWHTDRVLSFVRSQVQSAGPSSHIRVFSIGVGDGASTELCEGLARVGNGICFMATLAEDIAGRCASLLKAARVQPSGNLNSLTVDWGRPAAIVQQAPSVIPDVFPDTRYVVSAILGGTTSVSQQVTIIGQTPSGTAITMSFPVHVLSPTARRTRLLHVLAARRLITELDDQTLALVSVENGHVDGKRPIIEERIVRLSEDYQLASRYAAFVAVDDREEMGEQRQDLSDIEEESEEGSDSFQTPESLPLDLEDEVLNGPSDRGEVIGDLSQPPGVLSQPPGEAPSPRHDSPQSAGPYSESPTTTYTDADGVSTTYAVLPSRPVNALRSAARPAVMFIAGAFVHYVPAMEDFAEIITLSSGPARPIPLSQVFRRPPPRLSPPRQRLAQERPAAAQSQEKITQIARLQAHNGSFTLSPSLGALMARDTAVFLDRCRDAKPQVLADEDAWATILVLAFLRVRLAESRAIWEGLWTKAMDYATKCVSGGSLVVMQLVDQAASLL